MSAYTDILNDFPGFEDLTGEHSDWVPLAKRDHLPLYHIAGICFPIFSYQVATSLEFSLFTPLMSQVFNIPKTIITVIWALLQICPFVTYPLVNYYSDRKISKFGRRKIFILFGQIGIMINFILLYVSEYFGLSHAFYAPIIFLVSFIGLHISISLVQGPSHCLLNEIIPPHQKSQAKAVGTVFYYTGAICTYLFGGMEIGYYLEGTFTNDEVLIIICILFVLISLIISMISIKEEEISEIINNNEKPFEAILFALKNTPKPISRISLIYLLSWFSYFPIVVLTTNFLSTIIYDKNDSASYEDGKSFGMIVLAFSQMISLVYSFFHPKITRKFGLKIIYMLSMVLLSFLLIPLSFIKHRYAILVLIGMTGISSVVFRSVPFSIVKIVVPNEQVSTYNHVLLAFATSGQQASMVLVCSGLGMLINSYGVLISLGCVGASLSALFSNWMIVPNPTHFDQDSGNKNSIDDHSL
ncbi:major facilitator superfamily transporter [Tritrichomonas foetus]|uniref:Major facilitator superfamily transporter n=1 Tax=Tritrichomonas foetus TaxID=1144522 RepID=A0A1J4KPZ0_9EUKA|nr:major facilitator superfamily transporter [Tritrichomonas foetus]|eukprot:OHT13359.1 major facilitator superfamily transporter [Tritrichomonas foetus]